MQIDPDLHSTFFSNIVVTGGTTLTQGFVDRLQVELTNVAGGMKLKIRGLLSTQSECCADSIMLQTPLRHPLSECTRRGSEDPSSLRLERSIRWVFRLSGNRTRADIAGSQLWIGKDEYEEVGSSIVTRRAK